MKYYAIYNEETGELSKSNCVITNMICIEIPEDIYNNLERYMYSDGEVVINPNYEKEQEEKEKERISHLKCTKRVLALMLQEVGISYNQLKALIATNEQAQLEWDLCVELERCNPLLDIMGQQLGLSPQQIDIMFKYANGEVETLEVQ